MAESAEHPQQFDTVGERYIVSSIPGEFLYDFLFNYVLNYEETGSFSVEIDSRLSQEKTIIFETLNDLGAIIINLLQLKSKLLCIKIEVLLGKITVLEQILKTSEVYFKNEDVEENDLTKYRVLVFSALKKFKNERKVILSEDTDKILEDAYEIFLKYQAVYKKYQCTLKRIVKYSEKKLDICNVPRNCQEDLCIFISTLKENLTSCKVILASSERTFHDFESLITKDLIATGQKLSKRINLIVSAMEKVEFTFFETRSISFEVLNLECATRALY